MLGIELFNKNPGNTNPTKPKNPNDPIAPSRRFKSIPPQPNKTATKYPIMITLLLLAPIKSSVETVNSESP